MLPDFCWSPQHFHESWHDGLLSAQWCYLQHILMWAHRVYSHCQQVAHCTDLNWATNRTTDFVKSKVDLEYCLKWMNRCKYSHKFMIIYDSDKQTETRNRYLWSPYGIGQTIIFSSCDFFLSISFFLSSPNLSGLTLDVYHTSTHGVALVRI